MIKLEFNTKRNLFLGVGGVLLASLIALAFTTTADEETVSQAEVPALPVEIAAPLHEMITEWDEYTGRFEASSRVEVRARVSGFLEQVNFTDGELVKKGQVLFVIDQRPFKIELDQARANHAQALATLKTAQDNFQRVESLRETGAVSTEEYDRRKQALVHAEASVQLAQATVDNAKLNLEFTQVKAPISGLVSRDRVNEGNLVDGGSANSTLLTTIVATSPIHFYFTGSESDYLKYVRLAKDGKRGSARSEGLPVQIKLLDEDEFLHEATLDFVDNEIDSQTGTIESRAVLRNEDHLLEPGMFGKARIIGSDEHKAIMVPDEIIGTNQSLRFIYVLGENNQVMTKNVILGPLHSNGLRIVREGLSPNDKIITNNLQKIGPGMVVNPQESTISPQKADLASVH
ncbi:efflux RND transporter periplasmic adaptor subunit [Flagellimonas taeanensis]|uniref:efflux RND transporter periplasmic adaptor subunit n=1 Tax=Flavobacteriaceae TaxID=49546 RepID=UPI000E67BBF3|nr:MULTISPECIES: efflux RND transporter periplasmic adaptor subunit [Allomuricauda]MDC6384691.1 efflux RND transporter periplasmic adaptor subunit [Muricauda sp. SK9]RIV53564.1 efflux RND transporter periplasmic adaptor subunit [Allomuricauda taeanensis]